MGAERGFLVALLKADGFDHYGTSTTGRTNMLLGAYAAVDANWLPATTKPRNGICSLAMTSVGGTGLGIRDTFGATKTYCGRAMAYWFTQLPANSTGTTLMTFSDTNNAAQMSLVLTTTGTLQVYRGTSGGTATGSPSAQVVTSGSWAHVEMWVKAGSTTTSTDGEVEVFVNGTQVIDFTGGSTVRTINTANREYSQVICGIYTDNNIVPTYMDDAVMYDDSGSYNNAPGIGDKDVLPYYPDADGGTSAWVRNTGSSDFSAVNQTAQDGDTTYLEAAAAADVEDLEISAVPSTVDGIIGVVLINCLRKTQAGASEVSADIMETGSAASSNTAHVLSQSYAYYHDVIERNPVDGTTAWTYTTVSASKIRLTRDV